MPGLDSPGLQFFPNPEFDPNAVFIPADSEVEQQQGAQHPVLEETSTVVGGHKMTEHPQKMGTIACAQRAILDAADAIKNAQLAIRLNLKVNKRSPVQVMQKNDDIMKLNKLKGHVALLVKFTDNLQARMKSKYAEIQALKTKISTLSKKSPAFRQEQREKLRHLKNQFNALKKEGEDVQIHKNDVVRIAGKIQDRHLNKISSTHLSKISSTMQKFIDKGSLKESKALITRISDKLDGGYSQKNFNRAAIDSSEIQEMRSHRDELAALSSKSKLTPEDRSRINEIQERLTKFAEKLKHYEDLGILRPLNFAQKLLATTTRF